MFKVNIEFRVKNSPGILLDNEPSSYSIVYKTSKIFDLSGVNFNYMSCVDQLRIIGMQHIPDKLHDEFYLFEVFSDWDEVTLIYLFDYNIQLIRDYKINKILDAARD
jgi:hypothetical protein